MARKVKWGKTLTTKLKTGQDKHLAHPVVLVEPCFIIKQDSLGIIFQWYSAPTFQAYWSPTLQSQLCQPACLEGHVHIRRHYSIPLALLWESNRTREEPSAPPFQSQHKYFSGLITLYDSPAWWWELLWDSCSCFSAKNSTALGVVSRKNWMWPFEFLVPWVLIPFISRDALRKHNTFSSVPQICCDNLYFTSFFTDVTNFKIFVFLLLAACVPLLKGEKFQEC